MYTRTCGTLKCPRNEQEKLQTAVSKDKSVAENGSPQTTVSPDKLVAGCSLPPWQLIRTLSPCPMLIKNPLPSLAAPPVSRLQCQMTTQWLVSRLTISPPLSWALSHLLIGPSSSQLTLQWSIMIFIIILVTENAQ